MGIIRNNRIGHLFLCLFFSAFLISAPIATTLDTPSYAYANEIDKANALSNSDSLGIEMGEWILSLGAYVAGIGGVLLDLSIKSFAIDMKQTLFGDQENPRSLGGTIQNMWTVVRDIANIVFIFGFLYIGIMTIFRPDSSRVKGLLAQLIIAALLINFSLFFVQIIVDISSLFAGEIHKYIPSGEGTDIGLEYAHLMGLTGLYGDLPPEQLQKLTGGGAFAFFVIGTIFMMIAGFVMAAGAVLLIVRFVALVLFMIFSPLLFAAAIFMDMKEYWKKLINYALFAPAFLFLLYLSYKILENAPWNKTTSFAEVLLVSNLENTDAYSVILQFTVALFFLIAALKSADALGIMGGKAAVSVGNRVRGVVQSSALALPRGIGSWTGRTVVGGGMNQIQKGSERIQARNGVLAKSIRLTGLDRTISQAADKANKKEFFGGTSRANVKSYEKKRDAKSVKLRGAMKLKDAIGIPDTQEKRDAVGAAVLNLTKQQLEEAGAKTLKDAEVMRVLSNSQMEAILGSDEFSDETKAEFKELRGEAIEKLLTQAAGANATLLDGIGKASISQLEALGTERLKAHAAGLSSAQLDKIKSSKQFTETQVQDITTARAQGLVAQFKIDPDSVLGGKKEEEIAKMPFDVLNDDNAIKYITGGVLKTIVDKQTLTPKQRNELALRVTHGPLLSEIDPTVETYLDSPHGQSAYNL